MKIQPRDYQAFAIDSIFQYFASGNAGNPLVAAPTGTGKSVIIAGFLDKVFKWFPNQKILVLTHVKELIQQNYEKLIAVWPQAPAGVYSSGLRKRDTMQQIIFGGIASVARKHAAFGRVDLILIDEAHLVNPEEEGMYRGFIAKLKEVNPLIKVVGFTATPWRLGHGKITDDGIFTDICCDMTGIEAFNWLIAQGYLLPLVPKQTELMLDVDGVHKRGGEFIQGELQTAVDKHEITEKAVLEAIELGQNRNAWLVFAAGVEHAIHIAEIMNAHGIPTAAVHSKLADTERDQILADFKAGKLRCVTNNNVLTTGFDHPGIDLILMLRPTASSVLWVQMLGRGTRPLFADGYDMSSTEGRLASIQASGKHNCLVLDFAGNTRRLGQINDPVVPRKKGEKGGEAPVRLCEECNTYNHASARHCAYCGHEFHIQTKLKQAASTQALIKVDAPIVEVFKVDHITYTRHEKVGKPPMMKATYYCGLRMFSEFVCVEHEGFAQSKARRWWRERSDLTFPSETAEALELADQLRSATHLRIWINKQFPEILATCFDGTAFGAQESAGDAPTVQATANKRAPVKAPDFADAQDDNIPFDISPASHALPDGIVPF